MRYRLRHFAGHALAVAALFLASACANAGEIVNPGQDAPAQPLRVVSSGGFAAAIRVLAADYEKETGQHIELQWGPSMGRTADAIPARVERGEPLDAVVMVAAAIDPLIVQGRLASGSETFLAESRIACAVPAGDPVPDIATEAGLRDALLRARRVVWSDSASGEYLQHELFARLGVASQVLDKGRQIPATPIGEVLARREADFGCQQRSELQPVAGITIAGDLPASLQRVTTYAAAVVSTSAHAAQALCFLSYLASPESAAAIRASGLLPVATHPSHP